MNPLLAYCMYKLLPEDEPSVLAYCMYNRLPEDEPTVSILYVQASS